MTRRFNLLPTRYVERLAERRSAGVVVPALLLLIALLAAASLSQSSQLRQAERRRDAEQTRNAELLARRRALAPFRQLNDAIIGRERLLAASMATQVSWPVVMASLSMTFPADASLTSLTGESALPAFGGLPPVKPGDTNRVIGSTTLKGYSVEKFTPGVERMLQRLGAVTGLAEPTLQEGAVKMLGDIPVTTFEGTTFIDGAALTGRYAEGLPPEDDVKLPRLGGVGSAPGAPAANPSQAPK